MSIHEGAWAEEIQHRVGAKVNRVQALLDWSLRLNTIIPSSTGLGPSFLQDSKICIRLLCIPWGGTWTLFYHWTIFSWLLFLCSFLKLVNYWDLSMIIIVARLRSQNGLGKSGLSTTTTTKWLLMSRRPCLISFSGAPLPYVLTMWHILGALLVHMWSV